MVLKSKVKKNKAKKNKELIDNIYEKYEIVQISRRELKNAEYNPRKISDSARDKLKSNIKKVGLLDPPVWNVRSGNIVSGHQRIAILDSLNRTKDYKIRVAKVDLDQKTEKEQNIFFNNQVAMGEWDIEKLEDIIKNDIDFENAGFDLGELYKTFGDNPFEFKVEKMKEMSEQLRKSRETLKTMQKNMEKDDEVLDAYAVIVFSTYDDRKKFTDSLGLEDNRFIDGKFLRKRLKAISRE